MSKAPNDIPLPTLKAWVIGARPHTLPASIAPVVVGTAMAHAATGIHWPSAFCALVGSVLIQIGTNFANDYFDFVKGADSPNRLGPPRATQAGLIAPETMYKATILVFGLVLVPGAYILWRGGWPYLVIGAASILSGILYTAGPYAFGYLGLGDVFVFVFFGLVGVGGTFHLQTGILNGRAVLSGAASGLLTVAILVVDNLRDLDEDRRAGKRTLAVRFGESFARAEYAGCLLVGAVLIPVYLALTTGHTWLFAAPVAAGFAAIPPLRTVLTPSTGPELNRALTETGRLLLVFAAVFSLGWLL